MLPPFLRRPGRTPTLGGWSRQSFVSGARPSSCCWLAFGSGDDGDSQTTKGAVAAFLTPPSRGRGAGGGGIHNASSRCRPYYAGDNVYPVPKMSRQQQRYGSSFVIMTAQGEGEGARVGQLRAGTIASRAGGSSTTTTTSWRDGHPRQQRRHLSFSYAGPRTLDEILKVELLADQTASDISDVWLRHHETKEHVVGMCLKGHEGTKILERASQCRFYVQPIFRDDGFFMLLSQFQDPNHFLLAYLEDYKMDPASATPLVTFAVFTDFVDTKDLALVRADVLNASITDDEAYKVVNSVLSNYRVDDEYGSVQVFNNKSSEFDVDDYISRMNDRWNQS